MSKLFSADDFKSIHTERENDYEDIAEIANEKTKELQDKYEKAIEALKFYADDKNNIHVSSMFSSIRDTDTNVSNDAGKLARQVLKELGL